MRAKEARRGSFLKLNIWFVSAYDMPEGQSSRTYDFAMELSLIGHQVTMITSSYNHFTHEEKLEKNEVWREEWFGNIRVIWIKTFPYKDKFLQRGINMISNAWHAYHIGKNLKGDPDIITGPSVPLFTALSAYFLSKKRRCVFCFEVRDIWPQALVDLGVLQKNSAITYFLSRLESFLYHKAKAIIVVLPFSYKHIEKYGISKDKVTWIPNGVNLSRFSDIDIFERFDHGEKIVTNVMYIGGFSTTHGIDAVIETAKIFNAKGNTQVQFILIGTGKKKEEVLELGSKYDLKNIEFRDAIPKNKIPIVQNESDILVASVKDTAHYQFGINSNKIFDYLASGRPIIFAGKSPNNPIKEANAGITIPPENPEAMAEAIENFLSMSLLERRKLGENARRYAEKHYDTKVLAKKLESVFLKAVEE